MQVRSGRTRRRGGRRCCGRGKQHMWVCAATKHKRRVGMRTIPTAVQRRLWGWQGQAHAHHAQPAGGEGPTPSAPSAHHGQGREKRRGQHLGREGHLLGRHLSPPSSGQTRLLLLRAGQQHNICEGWWGQGRRQQATCGKATSVHTLNGTIFSTAVNDALSAGAGASACVARVPTTAPPATAWTNGARGVRQEQSRMDGDCGSPNAAV